MQHLTPVGLSQDGKNLVMLSSSGEEFSVPVDQRLRTALRGDHSRLGQLEMKMESALRPRDIQARIRGGETAEEVAAAAQTTVDAIMAFAAPVIAERAHVAQTAVKSSIRRASADTSPAGRTLEEASLPHLMASSVRADDVTWDAWRREDGRWNVTATYVVRGTEHRAEFSYDQPGRYVVADNDEARLLTGEASAPTEPTVPVRRLSAVPGSDELPLGDDAIELVRDPDPDPEDETRTRTDQTPADGSADQNVEDPAEDVEVETPRKKGRSSVPSWDEIMFGGGKTD